MTFIGPIDLKPRTLVRFEDGARIETPDVVPTPFNDRRAKEAWAAARRVSGYGSPCESLHEVMTPGELAYVKAVWDAMPRGYTSWYSAFRAIHDDMII